MARRKASDAIRSKMINPQQARQLVAEAKPRRPAAGETMPILARVPAELYARLSHAMVDRRARRQSPYLLKDVVADALAAWLDRHAK